MVVVIRLGLSAPHGSLSLCEDHDDVIKWKHFPRYWPFVRGIHRSPVNSPHKGQWRRALMFSLICAWINGWVNNGEAGDLRRHRAHYDVAVMWPRHQVTNGVDIPTFRELTFIWDYHKSRVMVLVNLSATSDTDRGVSRVPRGNDVTFLLKWGAWHSQKKLVSFHWKCSCGILCLIFPCILIYK